MMTHVIISNRPTAGRFAVVRQNPYEHSGLEVIRGKGGSAENFLC